MRIHTRNSNIYITQGLGYCLWWWNFIYYTKFQTAYINWLNYNIYKRLYDARKKTEIKLYRKFYHIMTVQVKGNIKYRVIIVVMYFFEVGNSSEYVPWTSWHIAVFRFLILNAVTCYYWNHKHNSTSKTIFLTQMVLKQLPNFRKSSTKILWIMDYLVCCTIMILLSWIFMYNPISSRIGKKDSSHYSTFRLQNILHKL